MGCEAGSQVGQVVEQAEPAAMGTAVAPAPVTGWSRASQAFSSLAVVNFRFLLGGTIGASFAMWMEQIGQGWLVAQLTNSPFQLGLVQFIRGISVLTISPFAGALAERVDRRLLAGVASMGRGWAASLCFLCYGQTLVPSSEAV